MKRYAILLILLVSLVLSGGCSQISEAIAARIAVSGSSELSDETIYSELSYLIDHPDAASYSMLSGKFEFVARLTGEAEGIPLDNTNDYVKYLTACISRNDNLFLVAAGNTGGSFLTSDIVKIIGEISGTGYRMLGDKQVLDIKALSIEAYTPPEIETSETGIFNIDGNEIDFVGAHRSESIFYELAVVYFYFTNNSGEDLTPDLSSVYTEMEGKRIEGTIYSPYDVVSGALNVNSPGIDRNTSAGARQLYYIAFEISRDLPEEEPIFFSLYDDEFRRTDDVGFYIDSSLAAFLGEAE